MTKNEFLNQLKLALESRRVPGVSEILADYQEHFTLGREKGKSEEEIAAKLGNPDTIAKAFETESMIAKVKESKDKFEWEMALRVVGRLLILAPFNILVLFIPGVIVFSLLVSAWSVAAGLGGAGIGVLSASFFIGLFTQSGWAIVACLAAGLGILGLAVLSGLVSFLISKALVLATMDYLKWNLKFVLEK